jgi:hypothetical protein
MSPVEFPAHSPRRAPFAALAVLQQEVASPRFLVYVSCTLLALVVSYRLGKDMQWDTLDYHFYAGFSAVHDRFGLDYFAAGPQSYLNPYAYAPFYLLVTSGLSALEVAGILAVVQSAILWLTYELAVAIAPPDRPGTRVVMGACAALLAFANPVLMEQFGSSFADITTAELVLAGSLVLVAAIRTPSAWRVAAAGFLLGAASALKLTNSLAAVSLAVMPLFLPVRWPQRLGSAVLYGLSVGVSGALVSLPWSIQLQRHFGNPLFPLFNGIFRSPQFTTARIIDFRFIPTSFVAALWRPFAMMAPVRMVHVERPAPDLRYAVLIVIVALLVLARWVRRSRSAEAFAVKPIVSARSRALLALGCAFLLDWVVWLTESGNSRYFIPMACVAAVLVVALACRLLMAWPRVLACAVAAILVAQLYRVQAGTAFRPPYPWQGEQWFAVSMPHPIASQPALYFSVGVQSSSFVVPYLPAGSGFINLEGDYVLGPEGANGAAIRQLITRFSPHLRVLVEDSRVGAARAHDVPHLANVDDAVAPFGLRVDPGSCFRILARAAPTLEIVTVGGALPRLPPSAWYTRYLVTCGLVPDAGRQEALASMRRTADLVLDRLEDACPSLLQPRRPETYLIGSDAGSHFWVRRYPNTDVIAWVHGGRLGFQKVTGRGRAQDAGSEAVWESSPPRVACSRRPDGDFLRILGQTR